MELGLEILNVYDTFGGESGFSYGVMPGALAQLGCCGMMDPDGTWVAGRGPDTGASEWQVQEPLQQSGCFLSSTARKFWQDIAVQSHF